MKAKKYLAAKILKVSPKKIKFKKEALEEIKKAITRAALRGLIATKKIVKKRKSSQSRGRARRIALQKKKGRRCGQGSRKGKKGARFPKKERWMIKVRSQRKLLKQLREKKLITSQHYRLVYQKIKGGFFRNRRHLKLYLTEKNLLQGSQKQN